MAGAHTIDVDEASVEAEVLAERRRRPVVVDFWAAWCGPCRVLGPVLERLAEEGGGAWRLAKVDSDRSPSLSARYRVQGIPAVKAFVGGAVVSEFVGVQPEGEIRRFLEAIVPGPAEEAAAEGLAHEQAGREAEARAAYERALSRAGRPPGAGGGGAGRAAAAGRDDEALRHLDLLPAAEQDARAKEIAALRLSIAARRAGGRGEAEARLAKDPGDHEARVALGRAIAAEGRREAALEELVAVVEKLGKKGAGDEARKAMLEVFETVGARSELADRYRERMARALYR